MVIDGQAIRKALVGIILAGMLSFYTWIVLQLIDLQVRVSVLEKATVTLRDDFECYEDQSKVMNETMNDIRVDVAFIRGQIETEK